MVDLKSGLRVQICCAAPNVQVLRDLTVAAGTSIQDAILQSGILRDVPDVDLTVSRVGIYGKLKPLDTVLRDHDRIEIYRPLIADPKDSRRQRAVKKGDKKGR
jgi:putative ubiquitin-RnfH superfamily antitoxin RatB of RatAB toxin-antitoxin module